MINHKKLRREFEAACRDRNEGQFFADVKEGLELGHLKPHDFSVSQLFDNFVENGHELRMSFNPRYGDASVPLLEAGGPVHTGHFANITGQIVYSMIMEAYRAPGFIGDSLFTTIPTIFDGEKIPGIGAIGDEAEDIAESQPYPLAGFSEEWIETPSPIKRGFIVPLTKEVVFFDRTGLMLKRAADVATMIRINKEKRQLDIALGITTSYRKNGAVAEATYADSGSFGDNLQASNALSDWTDIENALLLFDALTDPNTGEPIALPSQFQLVVPTALLFTARRIVNATEIRYGAHGDTSASTVGLSSNPLTGTPVTIESNPYVKLRTSSTSTYFIGDFKKAFAYMENWGITVQTAAPNSEAEFNRDVVNQWKVSERGAAAVIEPRYVVKCTA